MVDVALAICSGWLMNQSESLKPSRIVKNILGQKFGRLTVLEYVGINKHGSAMWKCRCDCGTVRIFKGILIRRGDTKSCGCWKRQEWLESLTKHGCTAGGRPTPEYVAWSNMRRRCLNPTHEQYKNYGGRGIRVCSGWETFQNFLADVGLRPDLKLSLHRIDNNKGYFPGNVTWGTDQEQQNARQNNSTFLFNGKRQTVAQWAREIGMEFATLQHRLRRGWTVEEALTTPLVFKRKV